MTTEPSSIPEPNKAQRRIIQLVAETHLATGNGLEGRVIRHHFREFGRERVNEVLDSCVPTWLHHNPHAYPRDMYRLTLDGMLCSPRAGEVSLLIETVLSLLRQLLPKPGVQKFTWDDICRLAQRFDKESHFALAIAVLTTVRMMGTGQFSYSHFSFEFELPVDVEDICECEDVLALAALRRFSEPPHDSPPLEASPMSSRHPTQGQPSAGFHHVRILHISDIHFRSPEGEIPGWRREQFEREEWRRERVLGANWDDNLRELAGSGASFDMVCATGDIADWGLPEEYERATAFFKNLMASLNLPMERLFLVPGNHDIHRPTEEEAWTMMRRAAAETNKSEFSNWIAGGEPPRGYSDTHREAVLRRMSAWRVWVRDELGCSHCLCGETSHPRLGYHQELMLPERPFAVHVVGLDSGWLAGDNHDQGKLQITEDQVARNATDRGKPHKGLRVALVHHPLTECADGSSAWNLLGEYTDLLLRGHQHEPLAEIRRDPDKGLVELAAGCLYEGAEGHRYPNGMQVIDITTDGTGRPICYDLRFRTWSEKGFWHDDSSIYRQATNGRLRIRVSDTVPS